LHPDQTSFFTDAGLLSTNYALTPFDTWISAKPGVEHWHARAIWVVSRADDNYPIRIKERFKDNAPPVLYGCGEIDILNTGALAVVGSRDADEELITYSEDIAGLPQGHTKPLCPGAREASIRRPCEGRLMPGEVIGVLADSLERTALGREFRDMLLDGRLFLYLLMIPMQDSMWEMPWRETN